MLSLGSVTDKSLYCVKNKLRGVEFSPFWFKMRTWPSSLLAISGEIGAFADNLIIASG